MGKIDGSSQTRFMYSGYRPVLRLQASKSAFDSCCNVNKTALVMQKTHHKYTQRPPVCPCSQSLLEAIVAIKLYKKSHKVHPDSQRKEGQGLSGPLLKYRLLPSHNRNLTHLSLAKHINVY